MAVALIALGFIQGWWLRIALAALTGISICEVYGAFSNLGARPARWAGVGYAILLAPVYAYLGGASALLPLTAVCLIAGFASKIFRGEMDLKSSFATVLPIIYPGMLFSIMLPLQDLKTPTLSTLALMLAFLIALMCDVTAYFIGRIWGRHKLCPNISPKKSVEGAIAGFVAAMVFAILSPVAVEAAIRGIPVYSAYIRDLPLPPLWHFAILGAVGGVVSQLGDLTASMLKRHCGIKDFGSILPGHGGILDRIDSVLFNAVVVFIYFTMVIK
jgi:phosphatidate cytidylyltransferase